MVNLKKNLYISIQRVFFAHTGVVLTSLIKANAMKSAKTLICLHEDDICYTLLSFSTLQYKNQGGDKAKVKIGQKR